MTVTDEVALPQLAPKDLLRIDIEAVLVESGRVNYFTGHLIRGALLALISKHDPELVSLLHDGHKIRPYSVAPIRFRQRADQRHRLWELRPGYRVSFRIASLSYEVNRRIIEGIFADSWEDLKIGETHLTVLSARFESSSFVDQVKQGTNAKSFEFRFLSPTKFEVKSESYPMLYPMPVYVFGGLGSLWNNFAPEEFHIDMEDFIEGVRSHVCITQHSLRTVSVIIKGHIPVTGFIGRTRFKVSREAPRKIAAAISLLSSFARYSGVGAKRSFGFGAVDTRPIVEKPK